MRAQARPFRPPAADPDVDVVSLREDPAVPPGHGCELEHEHPAPPVLRQPLVGQVSLERDAVDDRAAEADRLRGDPVRAVRADDRVDLDRLTVDPDLPVRFDGDADAVPKRRPGVDGPMDEELVEQPALRHQAEHLIRGAFDHGPVPEAAARARDPVLHHRLHREGQLPHGTHRETSAAGLVPREPCLVY